MTDHSGKVWAQRLEDVMVERQPRRAERKSVILNMPRTMRIALAYAAERRGMSLSGYARRAIMAFVCRDLGLDWFEIMADEPRIRRADTRRYSDSIPPGAAYGPWEIEGLREHQRGRG
jgi:hypothetical protein